MAGNVLRLGSKQLLKSSSVINSRIPSASYFGRALIGKREVVGYGLNGEYNYVDRTDAPMPAIRFKEDTSEINALREKEKGDWKSLTIDEKKELYRASFCQTFAEMKAPTGEWKQMLGVTLMVISGAMWMMIFLKKFVYSPLPESFSPEAKQKQLEFYITNRVDPIDGVASKWDYEKGQWKE